jgi:hypothetical protein
MLYYLTREVVGVLKTSFIAEESMTTNMKVGHCCVWGIDHVIAAVWLEVVIAVVEFDCNSRTASDSRQTTCSQLCNTSKQNFQCLLKVRLRLFWIQISGNCFDLGLFLFTFYSAYIIIAFYLWCIILYYQISGCTRKEQNIFLPCCEVWEYKDQYLSIRNLNLLLYDTEVF